MNIKTIVEETRSLSELLPIAQNSKGRTSFWGQHEIEVLGYDKGLHIDSLAENATRLIIRSPWNEETRNIGKLLAAEVNRVYNESDAASYRNPLTLLLVFLRTLPGLIHSIKFRLSTCYAPERPFYYSPARWNWKERGLHTDQFSLTSLTSLCDLFKYENLQRVNLPDNECSQITIDSVDNERRIAKVFYINAR